MNMVRSEEETKIIAEISKVVLQGKRFALFSHEEPEGDAIGCQVALTLALRELGKEAYAFRLEPLSKSLDFLNREEVIRLYDPARDRSWIEEADICFILDSCNYYRLGELADPVRESPALKINIDHHRDNDFFADINLVRFSAGGAAQLLFPVIESLGVKVAGTMADAIYVGMCTDTVGFRYIDPEGNVIAVIERLIKAGIDVEYLQEKIYCNQPDSYLDDLAALLAGVKYEKGGTLAWFTLPDQPHLTFYERELANEILKLLLSIKKIRASAMLHQEKNGVEVWLRSKTEVDVGSAALRLGGGGHRTASGALVRGGKLEETIPRVLSEVGREMGRTIRLEKDFESENSKSQILNPK